MFCNQIFLLVISTLIANSASTDETCSGENCKENIDVPMLDRMNAHLMAQFDIRELTKQIRQLVKKEVRKSVKSAIDEVEHTWNSKIMDAVSFLAKDLRDNTTKAVKDLDSWKKEHELYIGLTSCVDTTQIYANESIINFPSHHTIYGITNSSAFNSTGMFICDNAGLYLVSVTILSRTANAAFRIKRNSTTVASGLASWGGDKNTTYHSGTSTIVIALTPNDIISVQAGSEMETLRWYSCITIIKMK